MGPFGGRRAGHRARAIVVLLFALHHGRTRPASAVAAALPAKGLKQRRQAAEGRVGSRHEGAASAAREGVAAVAAYSTVGETLETWNYCGI